MLLKNLNNKQNIHIYLINFKFTYFMLINLLIFYLKLMIGVENDQIMLLELP